MELLDGFQPLTNVTKDKELHSKHGGGGGVPWFASGKIFILCKSGVQLAGKGDFISVRRNIS